MGSETFNLSWNDFDNCTRKTFSDLLSDQDFTDVTLVCNDQKQIKAHKVVLSGSSPMFRTMLLNNPQHPHPLVYLKGVQYSDLLSIIQFIYLGQTQVEQRNLETFMVTAKELEIQGLIADRGNTQGKVDRETVKKESNWRMDESFQSNEMLDNNTDKNIPETENEISVENKLQVLPYTNEAHVENRLQVLPYTNDHNIENSLHVLPYNPILDSYGYMNNKPGMVQMRRTVNHEKKHQCDQCEYKGITPQHVREHKMSIHEGIKFSCDLCEKVYSHPNNLRTHKKTKH